MPSLAHNSLYYITNINYLSHETRNYLMADSSIVANTVETATETVEQLTNWYDKALELLNAYGPKLVVSLLIFFIGKWLAKRVAKFLVKTLGNKADATLLEFISDTLYYLMLAVVTVMALSQLGVQTTSLVAILGTAGLAIGLAMKDSLSNLASGVMIIMFHPFRKKDFVEIGGQTGTVQRISMFTTILNTPDNKLVIVPNSAVMGGHITNYSINGTRRVDLEFGISYDDDIKLAKEVLMGILEKDTRVLAEPAPVVAVKELGDSSVNFVVRPWVKSEDYWDVFFDSTESAKIELEAAGCSIPYPQSDVHIFQEKPVKKAATKAKEEK